MPTMLLNSYRHAAAGGSPPSTPTLDTASAWWASVDDSGGAQTYTNGTLVYDQIGANDLTINGATFTNDSTYHVLSLDGTDDWLEAADNAVFNFNADYTILIVAQLADTSGTQRMLEKRLTSGSLDGWNLILVGTTFRHVFDVPGGATVLDHGTAVTSGDLDWFAARRITQAIQTFMNGTGSSVESPSIATATNTLPLRIGRGSGGGDYAEMYVYGAGIWKGTGLTSTQMAAAKDEILAVTAL